MDILNARMLAMQRAIDGLAVRRRTLPSSTATGTTAAGCAIATPHRTIVKGDSRSASIAAASILAKVSRDRYVSDRAGRAAIPSTSLPRHKGYGTKLHYAMLDQYGPCPAAPAELPEEVGGRSP